MINYFLLTTSHNILRIQIDLFSHSSYFEFPVCQYLWNLIKGLTVHTLLTHSLFQFDLPYSHSILFFFSNITSSSILPSNAFLQIAAVTLTCPRPAKKLIVLVLETTDYINLRTATLMPYVDLTVMFLTSGAKLGNPGILLGFILKKLNILLFLILRISPLPHSLHLV